jgi:predicted lipoprotein with Yx(FWY)xxD motif
VARVHRRSATCPDCVHNAIQVTYNGLPLYFFSGDSKPGDANGNYTNWAPVAP